MRAVAVLLAAAPVTSAGADHARVVPGYRLRFPEDEGSHLAFRTEWWYVTGWLEENGRPLGFQITFFRSRGATDQANPSAFAPRQLLIAHSALSDPAAGGLRGGQRVARAGFGLAQARSGETSVWIDDWSLRRHGEHYAANIAARDFHLQIELQRPQPPMLQGNAGFSRKGPDPSSASYYYSLPQLRVSGSVTRGNAKRAVTGSAWFDHEWSSQSMDARAVGWDWTGINLADGAALMAFRMREQNGGAWGAGGSCRSPAGNLRVFQPDEVRWTPLRQWRSPRSAAIYPVAWRVNAADLEVILEPLMDDQENDARLSTGAIYWEGAVRALRGGRNIGTGYLELTGYWRALKL